MGMHALDLWKIWSHLLKWWGIFSFWRLGVGLLSGFRQCSACRNSLTNFEISNLLTVRCTAVLNSFDENKDIWRTNFKKSSPFSKYKTMRGRHLTRVSARWTCKLTSRHILYTWSAAMESYMFGLMHVDGLAHVGGLVQ